MADDHGQSDQVGPVEQFDGREERVHVDVQHRRRDVGDRLVGDESVAAVLLAHEAIVPATTDTGPGRRSTPVRAAPTDTGPSASVAIVRAAESREDGWY